MRLPYGRRRNVTTIGIVVFAAIVAFPGSLMADEMPIFGEITGLSCKGAGESASPGFAVSSFTFGDTNPAVAATSGSGAGSGKPAFQDFSVVKGLDDCTPVLFEAVAKGTSFSSVTLTVVQRGSKTPVLVILLNDVVVTGDQFTEGAAHELDEVITLNYRKITITHVPSGNKVSIDLLTGTAQ